MKRNIDDFNGMSDFIISIITVVAWVLIGTIVTTGYFTIETKGESVMLSFISTIFTIISSLGIAATIFVYVWQKNDAKKQKNKEASAIKSILSKKCERIYGFAIKISKLINAIKKRNKEIEKHSGKEDNYSHIKISSYIQRDKYIFNIKNKYFQKTDENYKPDFSYTIKSIQCNELIGLLYTSASLDTKLYNNMNTVISTITEAKHILEYLIEFNEVVSIGSGDGVISYMEEELEWQLTLLCEIYYEYTGEDLESKKLVIR